MLCRICKEAVLKLPDEQKSPPAAPPARVPKRQPNARSVATPPGAETDLAECEYAKGVLSRTLGKPGTLADLVDEAQAQIKASAALRELLVRCRPYLRWDHDGDEAILVDALAAVGIGKPNAPAGAVLELEALRAAPPAAAPPPAAPPVAAAQRWDLDLMGRVRMDGARGRFVDGGLFELEDGRRFGPGAIYEARPAPEVQPQPGLVVSLLRGGRAEVEKVLKSIVLLKNGNWMELSEFQREARLPMEEPSLDDIPF
jgi:hypothetical protein